MFQGNDEASMGRGVLYPSDWVCEEHHELPSTG